MQLAPAWRVWLVENLLRGASTEQLVQALATQGVPAQEAQERIEEILQSPAYSVARQRDHRLHQYELILRLQRTAARSATNPGTIERIASPSAEEFFTRYYATNTPVILTDFVTRWPAYKKWTPAHFKETYGSVELQMTDGRETDPEYDLRREQHFAPTRMDAFVDRVLSAGVSNDFYLIARNYNIRKPELAPLLEDIDWSLGYLDRKIAAQSSALWFGPAGTVTPLHHDSSSILFAQVYGQKKLVLAAPCEVGLLHQMRAMYAAVDPERPETMQTPAHRDVLFSHLTLDAGEALFIPAGWWHYVRAITISISFAINGFVRPNHFSWYHPGMV